MSYQLCFRGKKFLKFLKKNKFIRINYVDNEEKYKEPNFLMFQYFDSHVTKKLEDIEIYLNK